MDEEARFSSVTGRKFNGREFPAPELRRVGHEERGLAVGTVSRCDFLLERLFDHEATFTLISLMLVLIYSSYFSLLLILQFVTQSS